MTVVVGCPSGDNKITIATASESADLPCSVEFASPTPESPLVPGTPKWANYVKGVVQNFKGGFILNTLFQICQISLIVIQSLNSTIFRPFQIKLLYCIKAENK